MEFELWPAVLAGAIAGAVMDGLTVLQKVLDLPLKQLIFRTWGRLFGLTGGGSIAFGVIFHELVAVVVAVIYAYGFQLLGIEDGLLLWGLIGAAVHYTIATVVVAMLPSVDPETGAIGKQGIAYKNYGALDIFSFFMGHMVFGVLVGVLYPLFHSAAGPDRIL